MRYVNDRFVKPFDCLNHELLIAKLNAYGFNLNALNLKHSYLTDRVQRVGYRLRIVVGQILLMACPKDPY